MTEEFRKFVEKVQADDNLLHKLAEAGKNYAGEQTEEAVFESIIKPIASEAGHHFTLSDMKDSIKMLDVDEMAQVSGGWGFGAGVCGNAGLGIGISLPSSGGGAICFGIGGGNGASACCGEGVGVKFGKDDDPKPSEEE